MIVHCLPLCSSAKILLAFCPRLYNAQTRFPVASFQAHTSEFAIIYSSATFEGQKAPFPENLSRCLQLLDGAKITLIVSGGTTLGQAEAAKAEAKREEAASLRILQKEQRTDKLYAKQRKDHERANADTLKASSAGSQILQVH